MQVSILSSKYDDDDVQKSTVTIQVLKRKCTENQNLFCGVKSGFKSIDAYDYVWMEFFFAM